MSDARRTGTIVLLNGVGSAGKSSIARALQAIASRPFLHVQMDAFLDMLPSHYFDHDDGLRFRDIGTDDLPSVEITTGRVAHRLLAGMRQAVGAMAREGNDLIVDDVLLPPDEEDYRAALTGLTVHWVGVVAPLDVLEAREAARGDRMAGLARWQYDKVHAGIVYDMTVDTGAHSAEEAARLIAQRFGL